LNPFGLMIRTIIIHGCMLLRELKVRSSASPMTVT